MLDKMDNEIEIFNKMIYFTINYGGDCGCTYCLCGNYSVKQLKSSSLF